MLSAKRTDLYRDIRAATDLKTSLHFRMAPQKEQVQDRLPTTSTSDLSESKILIGLAHTCLHNAWDKGQRDRAFGVILSNRTNARLALAT